MDKSPTEIKRKGIFHQDFLTVPLPSVVQISEGRPSGHTAVSPVADKGDQKCAALFVLHLLCMPFCLAHFPSPRSDVIFTDEAQMERFQQSSSSFFHRHNALCF